MKLVEKVYFIFFLRSNRHFLSLSNFASSSLSHISSLFFCFSFSVCFFSTPTHTLLFAFSHCHHHCCIRTTSLFHSIPTVNLCFLFFLGIQSWVLFLVSSLLVFTLILHLGLRIFLQSFVFFFGYLPWKKTRFLWVRD